MIKITVENLPDDDSSTTLVSVKGFGETSEALTEMIAAALRNKAQALIAVVREAFDGQ